MFWSPISLASFDVFFGTQRLGVAFVPINPAFSIEEMQPFITYIKPKLLLADASLAGQAQALAEATNVAVAILGSPGRGFDALCDAASDAPLGEQSLSDSDIHAIFLTSGSTGTPKGVMLSHEASWHRAFGGNSRRPESGGRGEVNMFPLFHWAGWHFSLCAWAQRRAIHLTPRADAQSLNAIIERWQPRYMYAIPAIWERLLESRAFGQTPCLRTLMTGTYRVEPSLIDRLRARIPGAEFTIGMGATELGVGTQIGDDDIGRKPYSVGLPAPGVEMRIIDGELCGRSPQLMSGYFDLPVQTAEAIRDGWYYTGDLATQDSEGYITITGRRREIIRSAAETIAPAEVEAAIAAYPGVREVAVVGLPDQHWGEIVCAALVMHENARPPDVERLRAFVAPHLAAFKHPRKIVVIEAIPRTSATGQVQRSLVREAVIAMCAADDSDALTRQT